MNTLITLPTSQPMLPQPPHLTHKGGLDYDLVDQLHATLAKISLWELIQTSPTYHKILQEALQNVIVPPTVKPNDVALY